MLPRHTSRLKRYKKHELLLASLEYKLIRLVLNFVMPLENNIGRLHTCPESCIVLPGPLGDGWIA